MKESKKSKRKRSYSSSSQSSRDSRDPSSSSSSSRRHRHSKKDKKSKSHKKHRQRSLQKQRHRNYERQEDDNPKRKYDTQSKQLKQGKNWDSKKQESSHKHQDIKQRPRSPQAIQQNPQVKPEKELPCFEPSGILLQYYNARQGVSLRFHEPPQSRQPVQQWRMYIFKGEQVLQPIMLTKSCYLIGKDERVADILTENPSISRQHAVIQFRLVQKRQTEGQFIEEIKPYVMDLESTNGTSLNDEKVQPGRYYELLHRDVLKFGFSDREYVLVKWEQNQPEIQQE